MFSRVFSSLVFSVPEKEGKVSLGRLVDSYPGDSTQQRGYFLHCFLSDTSLDFPLPWTLGCCTCRFVVDTYSYTTRTARPWHFWFTLHFVGIGVKGDKKSWQESRSFRQNVPSPAWGTKAFHPGWPNFHLSKAASLLNMPALWVLLRDQSPLCPLASKRTSRRQWVIS